jgi:transposase
MVSESVPAPDPLHEEKKALQRRVKELEEQKKHADERYQKLQKQFEELRQRMEKFLKLHYGGGRGEQVSREQLELQMAGMPEVLEEQPVTPPAKLRKAAAQRRPRRALDDSRLPERTTVIEPPEVLADPAGWVRLGEERSTQLDYVPGQLERHTIIRPRYVRRGEFAIAPLPAQPIDKGMVGAGLLAWLLMSKYTDHLPLYRLAAMLRRQHGVDIPRTTLSSWVEQAVELLRPVYRKMIERLRRRGYLQVDETPIRYLDPDHPGSSRRGYLWVYLDPGREVLFQWNPSRGHEVPEGFLQGFSGTLQTDGMAAYQTLANKHAGQVTLAHCWAHVRRKFHEATDRPRHAAWFVNQIQALYAVEQKLRENRAGHTLRAAVRSSESAMIVRRIFAAMERLRRRALPAGALSDAMEYALDLRKGLCRFLEDGRLEIDSNLVENAIRPCAVGRKNWLFIGHPEAGDRSAILYSLMASCRLHEINPYDYLKDVFTRIPSATTSQLEQFIPSEWAKTHRGS